MSYDANSNDAMFSRIMHQLDEQDETLREILAQTKRTNGRVTAIETREAVASGKIAVVSALVSTSVAVVAWLWARFD